MGIWKQKEEELKHVINILKFYKGKLCLAQVTHVIGSRPFGMVAAKSKQ